MYILNYKLYTLIALLFILVGCQETKPNAYVCRELKDSNYLYCVNMLTNDEKYISNYESKQTGYICTSPNDYEVIYNYYKNQCTVK